MNTYLKLSLSCLLAAGAVEVHGQSATEALRYSQTSPTGSARSIGSGGAFGAVGSDYSSASINPAGLGLIWKSEFSGTFSMFNTRTKSVFLENATEDSKQSINIPNLGLVLANIRTDAKGKAKTSGWLNTTFAIGFIRNNNFNSSTYFEGTNNRNSISDYFVQQANGQTPDALNESSHTPEGLAWQAYLIDPSGQLNTYSRMSRDTSYTLKQSHFQSGSGRTSDWNISYAANYSNFFYLGGTLSYSRLSYTENITYEEKDLNNSTDTFQSATLNKYLKTKGGGLNVKIGAILRPAEFLRLGLSYQSPTIYSLNDNYNMQLSSVFDVPVNGELGYDAESLDGYYSYRITTPSRLTGSVAYIFKDRAFLSADYEMVNYSTAKLNASDFAFTDANKAISSQYKNVGNLRLGGELRFDIFSIRAGYAHSGSPYKYSEAYSGSIGSRDALSLGIGIREQTYFIDLALVNSWFKDFTTPYTLNAPGLTYSSANSHHHKNVMVTAGLRF